MTEAERHEMVKYRLERARKTFQEVDLHIENGLWNTAINRIYYACFYALTSLLLKRGIAAKTHAGVRQMFMLHFVKTKVVSTDQGKFFSEIFDMRLTGDYDDFIDYTEEDVLYVYPQAKELLSVIERLAINSEGDG